MSSCILRIYGFLFAGLLSVFSIHATAQLCAPGQLQQLDAADGNSGDLFSSTLALSGDWLIVGAPGNDDAGDRSGSAYVFRRDDAGTPADPTDDQWIQSQKLTAVDARADDRFGTAVALNQDWAFVGALNQGNTGIGDFNGPGNVYVYRRDEQSTPDDATDDRWIAAGKLNAETQPTSDRFGASVAIDNDWLVVGAPGNRFFAGGAYFYRRDDNGTPSNRSDDSWVEVVLLAPAGGGEYLGYSVSISEGWAFFGANRYDVGRHRIYTARLDDNGTPLDATDDTWINDVRLTPPGGSTEFASGATFAFRGDLGIVADGGELAHVYSLVRNETPSDPSDDYWVWATDFAASDGETGDGFGRAIAISGDRVAVGAWRDDDACLGGSECDSGSAYLFRRDDAGTPQVPTDDVWLQDRKLTETDARRGDLFGSQVIMDGDRIVVGAVNNAGLVRPGRGSAFVFPAFADCNANRIADDRDLIEATSVDINGNQIPDECEVPLALSAGSRYIHVSRQAIPAVLIAPVAFEVTSPDYPCLVKYADADGLLVDEPVFQADVCTLEVRGRDVVPGTRYEVRVLFPDGSRGESAGATTARWGDAVGVPSDGTWSPADGSINIVTDAVACVEAFASLPNAPKLEQCDLQPQIPDSVIDILDIVFIVQAFQGNPYPFDLPADCP